MTDKRYVIDIAAGAARDLDDIHAYMADQRSIDDADALIDALYQHMNTLTDFPLRGSRPPEMEMMGSRQVRQILHLPFRLIYHVVEGVVTIIIVADGRRDISALLKQRLLGE